MTLSERAAYLKGLREGMNLDTEKPDGKLLCGILDMLEEVSVFAQKSQEDKKRIIGDLEAVEASLDYLEERVSYQGKAIRKLRLMQESGDDTCYEDANYEYPFDDNDFAIKCSRCEHEMILTEKDLMLGRVQCPVCGEVLDLDFGDDELDGEDFSIECPSCDHEMYLSDEDLEAGWVKCPNCGEVLDFGFDEDECELDNDDIVTTT